MVRKKMQKYTVFGTKNDRQNVPTNTAPHIICLQSDCGWMVEWLAILRPF